MLCCVCLLETHNMMGIFDNIGEEELNIADIISRHLWFKPNDILSSHICTICWSKIEDFHKFYQFVEKTHKDFHNVQQELSIIKEEGSYTSTNAIKQEESDEEEYHNVDTHMQLEMEIDNSINIQKNPLEESDLRDSDSGDDENDSNLFNGDEAHVEREKKKKNINKKRARRKSPSNKSESNPKRKKQIFNRLDPIYSEQMIIKHIPMGCDLCIFVGTTFNDIVAHFKTEHPNVRPYITCCDKKFTKRFYVAQHAMTHENPTCFSCELCNKSFTTTGGLQKHNLSYHTPDEECSFACDMCPKKFARQHLLQLHKTSHIPREEWSAFCTKCPTPKAFASTYLLNIHDNKLHKREKNICNVCAKEIKDKKSFEKHVREHYEGSGPRIKCPLPNCNSWLKDEDNLKTHLRRHNSDGETHKCPMCGKICPNRRALSSHKVYVHSKEVFRCELCDKTFKKAISLKEHMTQHTGEVLYNCPFCTRTFNSNANMHSHKKKQHPVEWEALRRQKMGKNTNDLVLDINKLK